MVTWSSTALVLLQSKYSHLSLSLSLLYSRARWVSSESNWLFNKKLPMVTWRTGSLSLSPIVIPLSAVITHTWIAFAYTETLESLSYICEMKNRFNFEDTHAVAAADTKIQLQLLVIDTTAVEDKHLLGSSLRHLQKLLSVFILQAIFRCSWSRRRRREEKWSRSRVQELNKFGIICGRYHTNQFDDAVAI